MEQVFDTTKCFESRKEGMDMVRKWSKENGYDIKVQKSSKGSKYVKLICKEESMCEFQVVFQKRQERKRKRKNEIPTGCWYISNIKNHSEEDQVVHINAVKKNDGSLQDIQQAVMWLQQEDNRIK